MIASELVKRLHSGETIKEISQMIGLNPSTIQRRLKKIGYSYNNSSKRWEWIGEGEEPLDVDILEGVNASSPKVTAVRKAKPEAKEECEVHVNSHALSVEEIEILRDIINDWKEHHFNFNLLSKADNIYERVRGLKKEDKARKTIVIPKSVARDFDLFTEKHHKIDKSDLIHLALLDFMEKYSV
jgi:hypothetical protein